MNPDVNGPSRSEPPLLRLLRIFMRHSVDDMTAMLREHGLLGRDYPQVNANTVAAFALGDYEWLLSFEADDLHDLVDMMRHLRYSDARLHVRDELPFHTGRRLEDLEDVAALLA